MREHDPELTKVRPHEASTPFRLLDSYLPPATAESEEIAALNLYQLQTIHDSFANITQAYQPKLTLLNRCPGTLTERQAQAFAQIGIDTARDLETLWELVIRVTTVTSMAKLAQDDMGMDPLKPLALMKIYYDEVKRGYVKRVDQSADGELETRDDAARVRVLDELIAALAEPEANDPKNCSELHARIDAIRQRIIGQIDCAVVKRIAEDVLEIHGMASKDTSSSEMNPPLPTFK